MAAAGALAKKGMLGLWTATKSGVSAVTEATKKTRDAYNSYQEKDVLSGLKKSGVEPVDLLVASLQKFFYLSAAGYKHELVAAAQAAASRLLAEGSSVQLDTVLIAGRILEEETLKRGSFEKSGFKAKLNELLKTGRASKEHYDREQLAHDMYYALLLLSEVTGAKGAQLANAVRACALRLVESPTPFAPAASGISIPSFDKSTSAAGDAAAAAIAAVNVSAHSATPSAPPMSGAIAHGGLPETITPVDEQADPLRYKLVKAIYMVASVLRKEAEAAEERRLKKLRDAEELLRKEQARMHGGI